MTPKNLLPLLAATAAPLALSAELRLAAPFSDNAILQRGMALPIWGNATPGESVSVSFAGQTKSTVTDAEGVWKVVLDPLHDSDSGALKVTASSTISRKDLRAGDVWICGGDSFMGRKIETFRSARSELAAKELPDIRLFRVSSGPIDEPQKRLQGAWEIPNRENVGNFPALAYFFGKALQEYQKVPIGLIEATDSESVNIQRGGKVTGSTVEAWISEDTLKALPEAAAIFEYYQSKAELKDALTDYENALADWKLKTGKAFGEELRELEKREPDVWYDYIAEMRKLGKPAPSVPPKKPTVESLRLASTRAGTLYHRMIAPIAGVAVRGIALNLGMGNAPRATQARTLFPALIKDWRRAWQREDLPMIFLQQGRASHPNLDPRAVSELREAQAHATSAPFTALVRTSDLAGNLFPDDIPTLAHRMATGARSAAERNPSGFHGPIIETVRFEGSKAHVRFKEGTRGLSVRGGGTLTGFALSEKGDRWAYAEAIIDGEQVVVSHPQISAPKALRYDWVVESNKEGNLIDASGLPALPYRSDSAPAFTDTPSARKPNAVATIQPTDLYPVVAPGLPRVLLIGDSIMNGYSPTVIHALREKANVVRMVAFGMIGRDDAGAAAFCAKLRDGDYALIHYNDGLHSLPPRITDEQFGVGLSAMLKHLKTVSPLILWATTTPAPDRNNTLGAESQNATVVVRNTMSKKIASDFSVPVVDLYGLVIEKRETLQGFANLHFTPEGSKLMGEHIAARILEALEQR